MESRCREIGFEESHAVYIRRSQGERSLHLSLLRVLPISSSLYLLKPSIHSSCALPSDLVTCTLLPPASTRPPRSHKARQAKSKPTILRPPKRLTAIGQHKVTRKSAIAVVRDVTVWRNLNSRCVSRLTYIHKCGGTAGGSYYRGMELRMGMMVREGMFVDVVSSYMDGL